MGFFKDNLPRNRFDNIDKELNENKQIIMAKIEELIDLQKSTNEKLDKLISLLSNKKD